MSVSTLSESTQNYLKAVWSLGEWSDVPVTASMVAARTGVALSTASDAIRKLSTQGLLEHARYSAVSLTPEGRSHAVTMVRRHRLIESFLVEVLRYRWDQVHEEADMLEHAVSDFMIDRIDELLGHPERDPHGDPIPAADGTVTRPDAVLLTSVGAGARVRVERISDDDSELLQFFADHGIVYGTVLETRAAAPYTDTLEVAVVEHEAVLPLGRSATDAVWVAMLE